MNNIDIRFIWLIREMNRPLTNHVRFRFPVGPGAIDWDEKFNCGLDLHKVDSK